MNISTLGAVLIAAFGGAVAAALLRRKRHTAKRADKAELHEWENEGGNLAPSSALPDTVMNMGSN